MALAVLRGCKFAKSAPDGDGVVEYQTIGAWSSPDYILFDRALDDVANALGYEYQEYYNSACVTDSDEVRRRIRAL